jgi:uncharacterized membrane protein
MRIALFLSVALNVLLVGVIAGALIADSRGARMRGEAAVARLPNMRVILDSLPPERASEVRSAVINTWMKARAERQGAREARLGVARAVAAEPYDVAATKAAFAKMRAADGAVAARFHDVVAEAMAQMTVEERRALLRQLAGRRLQNRRAGAPDEAMRETPPPLP